MSSSIDLDTQHITVDDEQCNDLYMGVACILARNSKDPEEKVPAFIFTALHFYIIRIFESIIVCSTVLPKRKALAL